MQTTPDPNKFLESCLWALIDANEDCKLTEVRFIRRDLGTLRAIALLFVLGCERGVYLDPPSSALPC